jgi:transposase
MTIIRIGLETSKHVFQVHGVDEREQTVLRRQLRRSQVEKFFRETANDPDRDGGMRCRLSPGKRSGGGFI